MSRRICCSQSVEGPLMNWKIPDWKRALKYMHRKDGTKFGDWKELKQEFMNMLAAGYKCYPIGECDNFDKEKGCRGHEHKNQT